MAAGTNSIKITNLRGVGEDGGHTWHLHILQTPGVDLNLLLFLFKSAVLFNCFDFQAEAVNVRGQFGSPGAPHVLPSNIQSGDIRDYQLHLTLASGS